MSTKRLLVIPVAVCAVLASSESLAQNLVTNPGFESGPSGWSGGSVVQSSPHSGANCLNVVDDKPTTTVAAFSAAIPVAQGQTYAFEAWSRTALAGQRALISIYQRDADSKGISGKNMDMVITPGTEWSRFQTTVRSLDPKTKSVIIALGPVVWTTEGEAMGAAFFDDIVLAPTDSSGTVRGSWLVASGDNRLWLSSVDQNVLRDSPLAANAATIDGIQLRGARGEYEAFQIVILPSQADQLTALTASELDGPSGAVIPASNITSREVAYVNIATPTDFVSVAGPAPDPLPLAQPPIALSPSTQQPLWLTVQIPESAVAGDYAGAVTLTFAKGPTLQVPLRLHVWNFSIPRQHHQRSAFGLSPTMVRRYHNLGDDTAKLRETHGLYMQDFAAHRIDANGLFDFDNFQVNFPGWKWNNSQIVDDPDIGSSNHVLEVNDTSTNASVAGSSGGVMPIQQGKSYRMSWRAKTDDGHDYLVSIAQVDAAGKTISGHNIDRIKNGNGSWTAESELIDAGKFFTPSAVQVSVNFFARPWSASGDTTGRTYFDDIVFAEEGSSDNLFPNGSLELSIDKAAPQVDFSRFDPAGEVAFGERGVSSFQLLLPGFVSMAGGLKGGELLGLKWGTPEYEALFGATVRTIADHLQQKGWLDKAYVYNIDEPSADEYPFVVEAMSVLHKADPRVKRLLTEQYEPELEGAVDIWTPELNLWEQPWSTARQAKGEQVWWYVCTAPRAPFFNYFIDHPAIERRVSMWIAAKLGVQGTLYWSTNYWTNDDVNPSPDFQDPWADPMSYNFGSGVKGTWGNGDGRLLYPPRGWKDQVARVEGPTPSVRWEQLREGLEDYEYFWLLRVLADQLQAKGLDPQMVSEARALLDIPRDLASSPTEFTDDPGALADYRIRVGDLLERMHAYGGPDPDAGAGGSAGPGPDGGVLAGPGAAGDVDDSGTCGCRAAGHGKGALGLGSLAALVAIACAARRRLVARGTTTHAGETGTPGSDRTTPRGLRGVPSVENPNVRAFWHTPA
jgi:hypothetical protein